MELRCRNQASLRPFQCSYINKIQKRFSVFVFLFLILSVEAADFLPKSFSFNFEQKFTSKLSKKEKISTGTLDYLYPGYVKFEIHSPDKVIFVSNKEKTWYYTAPFIEGEEGELTIRPTDQKMVLGKFFDALEKGLIDNEVYSVSKVKEGNKLLFAPKSQKELGIKEAILSMDNSKSEFKYVKDVLIHYTDDRKTYFAIKELKIDLGLNKDHFIFHAPPKTKISK